MASNRVMARRSFHRIWIAGKKTLVKRDPDLIVFVQSIEGMCYVENKNVVGAAPTGYIWAINTIAYQGATYIRRLKAFYCDYSGEFNNGLWPNLTRKLTQV